MLKRVPRLTFPLVVALAALVLLPEAASAQKAQDPVWRYGLSFHVRKATQPDFDKSTPEFGAEVFFDPANTRTLYITEAGTLSATSGGSAGVLPQAQKPLWRHGLKLKVRKGGAKEWTGAREYGVEVFEDKNSGNLVYLSDVGSIATIKAAAPVSTAVKDPPWLHGLDLSVRKQGENDFTDKTAKFGIEVYHDVNANVLVYICETGAIAVAPAPATPSKEFKNPQSLSGLELKVRKAGETEFSNTTKVFGVETFRDENTNLLVYISETGSLSVAPAAAASEGKTLKPTLLQGMELKVRKAEEVGWGTAKKYGGEIFRDENTGNIIYICETGALAVTPAK